MITISALKWVPDFARGQVRDYRVRWILKEVGWDYRVELLDPAAQSGDDYRREQPFGQVPVMREDGRPTLFETGAIVWSVAERAGILLPDDRGDRDLAHAWLIAALNSVEPFVMNVAEARYFIQDGEARARREAEAMPVARQRLAQLAAALRGRDWLVGGTFTVADLIMTGVLIPAARLGLLDDQPLLENYLARATDRKAYRDAVAEQERSIDAHGPGDMGWGTA